MGTTLTGTTPQDTYDSLIKVTDNGPLSGTAKYLSDGLGNDSVLALSTTKVGINTSSPDVNLHISGDANGRASLRLASTAANRFAAVSFYGNNVESAVIGYEGGSEIVSGGVQGDLIIRNVLSGKDIILDTNAGNVGIGTLAPAVSLQVGKDNDVNSLTGKSIIYGANQDLTGTPVEILTLCRAFNAGVSFLGAAALCVAKDTANANPRAAKLSIKLSDAASETDFVAASFTKNGLCFNSDTAAANALDDYEEGTWTMGVSFGGASVGVTYSNSTGTYTKIGRQVTVNGLVELTNKGTSTGLAAISGLPFPVGSLVANYGAASVYLSNITFLGQFMAFAISSESRIRLRDVSSLGVIADLNEANFANNSTIMVNFTYFV
jgi:hypothetical protein